MYAIRSYYENSVYAPRADAKPWYARILPASVMSPKPVVPPSPDVVERGLAAAIQGAIEVKPVRNSQLLQISSYNFV